MKTKHAFIAAHASGHAIRFMCRVLGVAHSWFHARRRAAPKRAERAARRGRLGSEIREIFEQSKRCYGAPRIHAELKARGFRTSKRTVAKLMRENGIRPPRGRRRAPITTDSRHSHAIAPNLLDRNFEAVAPDAVWLADISYIPTDEGWLYLAAVKDLATMEIVGWSMSERLKSVLCEEALKMAIRSRRLPMGLIHHSDRGVQYACGDYRKLLRLHGIKASMSRKGNCLDNARATRQRAREEMKRLMTIPGIGPICAMALHAFAPPMESFGCGRDFAAWVGLTPRQHSTAGKHRLGRITKMGQRDLRQLLVLGATSVLRHMRKREELDDPWLRRMIAEKLPKLVAVALANKMARIIWVLSVKKETYRAPGANVAE